MLLPLLLKELFAIKNFSFRNKFLDQNSSFVNFDMVKRMWTKYVIIKKKLFAKNDLKNPLKAIFTQYLNPSGFWQQFVLDLVTTPFWEKYRFHIYIRLTDWIIIFNSWKYFDFQILRSFLNDKTFKCISFHDYIRR